MALEWPQFGEEAREKDSVDDVAFGMTSCCHSFSHIPGADQDRVLVEWAIADSMRCQWVPGIVFEQEKAPAIRQHSVDLFQQRHMETAGDVVKDAGGKRQIEMPIAIWDCPAVEVLEVRLAWKTPLGNVERLRGRIEQNDFAIWKCMTHMTQ